MYADLEALQSDLDEWINKYNYERPHRDYGNRGRRPFETIELSKQKREAAKKKAA
jgi:transposase InsO family protein